MSAAAIAVLLQALEDAPEIVQLVSAGYAAVKDALTPGDQASVEAAITKAKAQLDTDVARVEAEA